MGFWEAIVSIIDSLAWPATLLALVYLFRQQCGGLIESIESFKWGKMEARRALRKFNEKTEDVDEELPKLTEGGASIPIDLTELAELSPRAAIMEGWYVVEEALKNAMTRLGLEMGGVPPSGRLHQMIDALGNSGKMSFYKIGVLKALNQARNMAAHGSEKVEDVMVPDRYVNIALRMKEHLDSLKP